MLLGAAHATQVIPALLKQLSTYDFNSGPWGPRLGRIVRVPQGPLFGWRLGRLGWFARFRAFGGDWPRLGAVWRDLAHLGVSWTPYAPYALGNIRVGAYNII